MSKTKTNNSINITFVDQTTDIRNLSVNNTYDVILPVEHCKVIFSGQGTPSRTTK